MQVDKHNYHGLLHSADLIASELRRHLAPLGIHPRQANVIEAMYRMGPVSQADLAETFGISSASMSTMTDRLLAAGYITRTTDPDSRRKNILELTREGHALLKGIDAAWTEIDKSIEQILEGESEPFFELCRKLREGLGGVVPGTQE